jgi:hypothetical protein
MSHDDLLERIASLTPSHLEAYLQANDWRDDGDLNNLASIWHRPEPEHQQFEVLLPRTTSLKDYRERVIDVIATVANFEAVTPAQVIKAMNGQFADLVRIRVIHEDVSDGSIPLKDGVQLNLAARDLMAAAAMSTPVKRRHFAGKRSADATAFLDSLLLGQTEEGSYIVNIIAPIGPLVKATDLFPAVPLANVVTDNLASSLAALNVALGEFDSTGDYTLFDATVERGASANLCDALVGLSGTTKHRDFEVTVVPSLSRESRTDRVPRRFEFDMMKVKHIAAASEYLKDNYLLENHTIRGLIKRLDRAAGEEIGNVMVAALVRGTEKYVAIELTPDEYMAAIDAHRLKDEVQCTGDLHISPRAARLLNPKAFRVLTSGTLFGDLIP